ncbi:SDR family NAD(P)-dependent oxidoreductase [Nocardioides lentus]|uniref:SDR family NAD(P)-dependent oxidoreductase n=1 Tax=Nocardioides lentus TaxID=338077 RepID=A0ABP5AP41_9ACTN
MAPDAPARTALVTGAAGGIGARVVDALVADGCRVLALDLALGAEHDLPGVAHALAPPAALTALAERHGDAVLTVVGDVRDPAVAEAAVRRCLDRWGRLDVVVAAAAVIAGGRPLWETPTEELDTQWDVGARGVWHVARAAVPAMLAGPDPGGCRFVAVASAAGGRGLYALSAYTMVKHAVVGLVRGLAADLVGTGVTVVAVSPGATDTAMLRATADLYGVTTDDLAAHQLLRAALPPAQLAETIRFCCSTAGRVLNGSVVAADGGFG